MSILGLFLYGPLGPLDVAIAFLDLSGLTDSFFVLVEDRSEGKTSGECIVAPSGAMGAEAIGGETGRDSGRG